MVDVALRAAPAVSLDEERAVLVRLQAGDRAAAAALWGWFSDALYRSVLRRGLSTEAAEDVVRESFRAVLEKISTYRWEGRSLWFWLHRIATNRAMDVHRASSRGRALQERLVAQPEAVVAPSEAVDRGLDVADTAAEVSVSLSRLHPRYAEALRMRLLEEQSREACAAHFGVTVATFDVLFHRACKAFREEYPP
ncbi:MAG: hypothetical protein RLZZ383_1109 [Pseudomonadota bacterium]|jgi:RNA polymerase sigma-70 factor (ECF subfamily)